MPQRGQGRRGHCTAIQGSKLYILGGYPLSLDLHVFDFSQCEWKIIPTGNSYHPALQNSGSSCVVIKDSLFVFGGFHVEIGTRNADISELNLKDYTWKDLKVTNPELGPLFKDKAGVVDYGEEMLCVMGGFGYPPPMRTYQSQKGASYHREHHGLCWSNELHLFHINLGKNRYLTSAILSKNILCVKK